MSHKIVKSLISLLIYKKRACKYLIGSEFCKVAGSGWLPDE